MQVHAHQAQQRVAHARPVARQREHAVTMVELIVVVLIVAVIVFAGLAALGGSKDTAQLSRARSAAVQLGEAVQQFQRDHGGRPPGQPGTADWGNGWVSPVDRGNGNRPYLSRRAVEAVSDGAVSIEGSAGATGPGASPTARIRYLANPARNSYALVVYVRERGRLAPRCFISNSASASLAGLLPSGVTRKC